MSQEHCGSITAAVMLLINKKKIVINVFISGSYITETEFRYYAFVFLVHGWRFYWILKGEVK